MEDGLGMLRSFLPEDCDVEILIEMLKEEGRFWMTGKVRSMIEDLIASKRIESKTVTVGAASLYF